MSSTWARTYKICVKSLLIGFGCFLSDILCLSFDVLLKGQWTASSIFHRIEVISFFDLRATKMYIFGRYSLNDALSMLDETNEDYSSVDLYILPPNSTSSDGDSDDEDELESLNHVSGKQLAPPTEVVMHTVEPATSSSSENENSSTTRKAARELQVERKRGRGNGSTKTLLLSSRMITPNYSLLTKTGHL